MALPFTDDFTDTDGTALATHNADWTVDAGALEINNNRLQGNASGTNHARWTGDTLDDDQVVTMVWGSDNSDGSNVSAIGTRAASSAQSGYFIYIQSTVITLYEVTAGSFTVLSAGATLTMVSPADLELKSEGTLHTTLLNGSTTNAPAATTDSTHTSGSAWVRINNTGTSGEINSITIDDVAAAGVGIQPLRRRLIMRNAA